MCIRDSLPTQKAGIFSLFGLAGLSSISEETIADDSETLVRDTEFESDLGAIGLNHTYLFNNSTYQKTSISLTRNGSGWDSSDLWSNGQLTPSSKSEFIRYNTRAFTSFNKKVNSRNTLNAGAGVTFMNYDLEWNEREENGSADTRINDDGRSSYLQSYLNWKHRFTEDLSVVSGLHFIYFTLNNTYSVEPRISASWSVRKIHTFSAGFGLHSRLEMLGNYMANITDESGNVSQANKDLEIPKSMHFVAGYDFRYSENAHMKIEAYYQDLFDIGVEDDPSSSYSLINQVDGISDRTLVSEGDGFNYGVELTLERFFANNYYYLVTASVFESKYRTLENIWRRGRFSNGYIGNLLVGKEFKVGDPSKHKSLSIDLKFTLMGGNRYTPVNEELSMILGEEVLYEDRPYSVQGDDIFIANISGRYKKNNPRTTHILKFEIVNATNNAAVTGEYYDGDLNRVEQSTQLEMIPNIMYVLQF